MKNAQYALLPAFFDGMLDAANPGTKIIDGNEGGSYYIDETSRYPLIYDYIKNATKNIIDNKRKWETNGQIGYAIYVDYVSCYLNQDIINVKNRQWEPVYYNKWMQHNFYQALLNTDEYVWVYSEIGKSKQGQTEMDWWSSSPKNLPEGIVNDIQFAKNRYEKGLPLGFDMVKKDCWNPYEKAVFTDNSKVTISWKASDKNDSRKAIITADIKGKPSKVEFYMDSCLVETLGSAPYNINICIKDKKYHEIYVRVTYFDGKHVSSNIISLTTEQNNNRK